MLYEGDNDIAAGEMLRLRWPRNSKSLSGGCTSRLPQTQLIYLSIKPSLARWKLYPQMKQANDGDCRVLPPARTLSFR